MAVKGFSLFGIEHTGMQRGVSIPVIGEFLQFTFVENPGMAFGLDFGMPLLLGLFSIGAAIFLVHLLRKSRDVPIGGFHIALAMILGGAVGNLIDRVFYGVFYGEAPLFKGKVVDFINVDFPDFLMERFYIFNIADSAVSVGIVLLLIYYPKYQRMIEEKKKKEEGEYSDTEIGIQSLSDHTLSTTTGGVVEDEMTSIEKDERSATVKDEEERDTSLTSSKEDDELPHQSSSPDTDSTSSGNDSSWSDSGSSDFSSFD